MRLIGRAFLMWCVSLKACLKPLVLGWPLVLVVACGIWPLVLVLFLVVVAACF